jgi:hypothetical protein
MTCRYLSGLEILEVRNYLPQYTVFVPTCAWFLHRLHTYFPGDTAGQSLCAGGATGLASHGSRPPPPLILLWRLATGSPMTGANMFVLTRSSAHSVFLWFPFAYLISLLSTFHMFTFFLTCSHLHLKISHFHLLLALTGTPVKNVLSIDWAPSGWCICWHLAERSCFSPMSTDSGVRKSIRFGIPGVLYSRNQPL